MSFETKTTHPPQFVTGEGSAIGFRSIYISHVTAITSFKYAKKRGVNEENLLAAICSCNINFPSLNSKWVCKKKLLLP